MTKTIQQNIVGANKNIDQTRQAMGILQEVLVSRLTNVAKERAASEIRLNKELTEIKKNQTNEVPLFKALANESRQINEKSTQIQQSLKESIEAIDSSKAQSDLANQKLAKLIDILKAIAVEQGKIDRVLQKQENLDVMLQAQAKVGQVLNGQAQGKVDQ